MTLPLILQESLVRISIGIFVSFKTPEKEKELNGTALLKLRIQERILQLLFTIHL